MRAEGRVLEVVDYELNGTDELRVRQRAQLTHALDAPFFCLAYRRCRAGAPRELMSLAEAPDVTGEQPAPTRVERRHEALVKHAQ